MSGNHEPGPDLWQLVKAYNAEGPELRFLINILKRTVVFVAILGAAAAVKWVNAKFQIFEPSILIDWTLWLIEWFLIISDILWYVIYLAQTFADDTGPAWSAVRTAIRHVFGAAPGLTDRAWAVAKTIISWVRRRLGLR